MPSEQIRYYCQNCDHRFTLGSEESLRCPKCFWTTSVQRVDDERKEEPSFRNKEKVKSAPKSLSLSAFLPIIRLAGAIVFILIVWMIGKSVFQKFQSKEKMPRISVDPVPAVPLTPPKDPSTLLSEEEKQILSKKIDLTIPRKLSSEENEIIVRRVDLSVENVTPASGLRFWTMDDFKNFLTQEQQRRKIYFPSGYKSALAKLFKDHYLKAESEVKNMHLSEARTELFNALLFPVYSKDIRLHRGVALVMLQGYINDIIGKIHRLDSMIASQVSLEALSRLKSDYDSMFHSAESGLWNDVLTKINQMEEKAKLLESELRKIDTHYPPFFTQIDPDIQRGLSNSSAKEIPILTNLSSLLIDLKLKKKQIEQNLDSNLEKVKAQYETALKAIQISNWEEAKSALQSITYPPEVVSDAKQKLAVLEKLLQNVNKA